jgi:capsular exopolysaccharide synthesis family protein
MPLQNPHQLPEDPRREVATVNVASGPAPIQIQLITSSEPKAAAAPAESNGLAEYGNAILRRKWSVLAIAAVCAIAAFLIALPQPPVYQARTALEIQGMNENFLNFRDVNPTSVPANFSGENYLQTQLRILQDESLLERVVDKMGLESRPEYAPRPLRFAALRKALHMPDKPLSAREQAISSADHNLKIRASGTTRIVEVLFDSTDPRFAADFANAMANEFIDQNLEYRWQTSQKTGEWLTRQMNDLKGKLERSQEQLLAYARDTGLMYTSDKVSVAEQKLRELQDDVAKAQSERVATQSKYEAALISPPESLPQVLDSEPLRVAQQQLNDLKRQHAELSTQFTPAFYKVKNVQAQITELESILKRERNKVVERMRNDYEAALRREKLAASGYGEQLTLVTKQAEQSVHYDMLKHEVDTNRGLYESMLQKVKEANLAAALRTTNIRVLSPARLPERPYKPNPPLNGALGLGAGLMVGIVFALHRERAGRSIKAPGDASTYLDLRELGVIPVASEDLEKQFYGRQPEVIDVGEKTERQVELVTWQRKPSLLAESFRATLASILFAHQNGSRPHVIVVSSPDPAAGKTTIVTNLGIALAEINRRVLLIDADLRKPRLHEIFHLSKSEGLSRFLKDDAPVEDYPFEDLVCATEVPGLYVMPAGGDVGDISSLLYSSRMAELLWRFRLEFHTVLIDTPPMLHLPDARILGRQADGVVLVLRASQTHREHAVVAAQRLKEDGTRVVGSILNQWAPESGQGRYYGYYKRASQVPARMRPRVN